MEFWRTTTVKRGGHVIVSTFGPEGPAKCNGPDVVRYNAESLHPDGRAFPLIGKLEGIVPHAVWHDSAVAVLLLHSGKIKPRSGLLFQVGNQSSRFLRGKAQDPTTTPSRTVG